MIGGDPVLTSDWSGVEEDRGEADQVPGPGSAQLREPEEGLREASQRGVQPQSPDQAREAGRGAQTRPRQRWRYVDVIYIYHLYNPSFNCHENVTS